MGIYCPVKSGGGQAGHHCMAKWLVLVFLFLLGAPRLDAAEEDPAGKKLFAAHCSKCHGDHGQGLEDYDTEPLQGAQSLADLIQIVDATMPEDDPDKCTGDEAKSVARYIYAAFYEKDAKARRESARIDLARLTVRQYDNTVADLLGTFLGEGKRDAKRGLQARYYNARKFARGKLKIERTDPRVLFDFKDKSPDPEKIGAEEFAMQWQGGVIADETGDYEFCISTENGARLWVNDTKKPFIDAWVVSGDEKEHRGTVRLLGGRVYPIRLECFKSKQQKTSSIALKWQPPHKAEEVIPRRNLSPNWYPPTFVVTTPFPPDDSSVGYERGTTVSRSWDRAKTYAAVEIANAVVENLDALAKTKDGAADRKDRVVQFCHRFAERAFRRPLTPEQKNFFVDRFFGGNGQPEAAAKKAVLLVLLSPRFLYLGIGGDRVDDYDVAARLAQGLWDSLPDAALLQAAQAGKLRTPDEVARQARRMLPNFRTKSKLNYFFHNWLNIDHLDDISKDKERYRGFDDAVASSLRTSLDLLLDDVVWGDQPDYRKLLLADYWFVNDKLAEYYDVEADVTSEFQKVPTDPARSAGILTHPFMMARFAYHKSSSPIHRGVFVIRSLLGRSLKPPPIAVAPEDEGAQPDLTTRQRVEMQTRPAVCQTCHILINPLGFSFENFDAVGKYREAERQQPIDASGFYKSLSGEVIRFDGVWELARFLADSEEAHQCFVQQLFHNIVKQPIAAYGPDALSDLRKAFAESGFNIQELLVKMMAISALRTN